MWRGSGKASFPTSFLAPLLSSYTCPSVISSTSQSRMIRLPRLSKATPGRHGRGEAVHCRGRSRQDSDSERSARRRARRATPQPTPPAGPTQVEAGEEVSLFVAESTRPRGLAEEVAEPFSTGARDSESPCRSVSAWSFIVGSTRLKTAIARHSRRPPSPARHRPGRRVCGGNLKRLRPYCRGHFLVLDHGRGQRGEHHGPPARLPAHAARKPSPSEVFHADDDKRQADGHPPAAYRNGDGHVSGVQARTSPPGRPVGRGHGGRHVHGRQRKAAAVRGRQGARLRIERAAAELDANSRSGADKIITKSRTESAACTGGAQAVPASRSTTCRRRTRPRCARQRVRSAAASQIDGSTGSRRRQPAGRARPGRG